MSGVRQVNNRKSPVAQTDVGAFQGLPAAENGEPALELQRARRSTVIPVPRRSLVDEHITLIVRPAVRDRLAHCQQQARLNGPVFQVDYSSDSTHGLKKGTERLMRPRPAPLGLRRSRLRR